MADSPTNGNGHKAICETSPDTLALVDMIQQYKPGSEITYGLMADHVDRTVAGTKSLLQSVRRILARDHGMAMATIRDVGWKVLEPDQVPGAIGDTFIASMHRQSRRKVRIMAQTTRGKELSNEALIRLGMTCSVLGAIRLCSAPKARKRLAAAVQEHDCKALPVLKTFELFGGARHV